ncbi:MAG: tol-pal system protein YbgF [Hyphomicrobiaceae bacterium]
MMRTTARRHPPHRLRLASLAAAAALILTLSQAAAQSPQPLPPPKAARQAPAAKPAAPAADAGRGTEAALRQRVEQLEEQIVEMQVAMGTLESLAKGGAVSSQANVRASGGFGGTDSARIDALETQVRALTAQIEQLTAQLRSGRSGALPAPQTYAAAPQAAPPPAYPAGQVGGYRAEEPRNEGGFGATTVQPGDQGYQDRAAPAEDRNAGEPRVGFGNQVASAPLPGVVSDAGPDSRQSYETAYGYMLQQDYGAAQAAFGDFLKRYPQDHLAGNAQYWLGETYYVRGQFKEAAAEFLKGYQSYSRGPKAPDSLLKLAMSLDKLGQKDAACSSYSELSARFPNAPASIRSRADAERRRVGC